MRFPGGRSFAFSVIDDTDVSTLENAKPLYDLLRSLGMRTTKTVWASRSQVEKSNFAGSHTLEDPEYRDWVLSLHRAGFEIASHGASMESSDRGTTERAHATFLELLGEYPRTYANHAENRENIYWGSKRLDDWLLRPLYGKLLETDADYYQGDVRDSQYWWGDLCQARHRYVRNLTFNQLDVLAVNPSMPYHDETRPLVNYWFSATDAEDVDAFVERLTSARMDALEASGGVCIMATHIGKGFVRDGIVDERVERALRYLAAKPGWFAPVGEILDHLRSNRSSAGDDRIPTREWQRMQRRWAVDLVTRRIRSRIAPYLRLAGK